jgi:DNA-binding NarL/FixJ family response regulator
MNHIFAAAREALTLAAEQRADYAERLARIKQKHSRAYERWTDEEDAQLRDAVQRGTAVSEIAQQLQRQPGAIRSRPAKLRIG